MTEIESRISLPGDLRIRGKPERIFKPRITREGIPWKEVRLKGPVGVRVCARRDMYADYSNPPLEILGSKTLLNLSTSEMLDIMSQCLS